MRPNRAIRWLLVTLSSRDAADATIGDLLEELDERMAEGRAPRWPRAWLTARMLRAISVAAASALPTSLRSAGLTVRDAARSLRRSPAQSLFILLILGTAISAATVTFSVVDAVMLKPLPFDQSDRLVLVWATGLDRRISASPEALAAVRDRVPGLESVGAATFDYETKVQLGASVEHLVVSFATVDYMHVLRLRPVLGRFWTEEEARADDRVAMIGYEFWQSRFGGAQNVLGREVGIFGRLYRIVGVAPAGTAPSVAESVAVWLPTATAGLPALGRLRPNATIAQVEAQVRAALIPVVGAQVANTKVWKVEVRRWDEWLVGTSGSWLMLILTAVLLVVLIGCVNVANVLLTRSSERAHDLAIRASLGASRHQLAASLLTESVILAAASCAGALLFASWGIAAITKVLPPIFRSDTIALDGRVLIVSVTAAVLTGLLAGAVPAWQASRASVVELLKDATPSSSGRRRWRTAFLVGEIASVGVLLVVSTLFIASFIRVATRDLGFDREHLLTVSTLTDYKGTVADVKHLLERIPGVTTVAAVTSGMPPLVGIYGGAWTQVHFRTINGSATIGADIYSVTPDYFAAAGMTFRNGSTWSMPITSLRPVVLDQAAAQALFPTQSPIGQQVLSPDLKDEVLTVVGVVPRAFQRGPELETPSAYVAMRPDARPSWVGFVLRTSALPASLVRTVESTLAEVALPDTTGGAGVRIPEDAYRRMTAVRRFNAGLMTAFAIVAILIGAAGIYAVIASVVAQQTREIGVRVALGATSADIRRSVFERTGRHVLAGLALGLPVGWLISRGFASLFFQVTPGDPSIYVVVAVTIGVVGFVSALIPARRAARVDPVVSLRAS